MKGENPMKDTNGTIVIAEAVKNTKTNQRIDKIVADLLCVLCDDDCAVNEALDALNATQKAIHTARLSVLMYGNNVETEDSYAEGED